MNDLAIPSQLVWLLGGTLIVYVLGIYGLGYWAQRRIQNAEDFLVAGRRLPFSLASATLLATWFGAGTLLTAADEVRHAGLPAAALDPLGPGVCLILAGLFYARPLWNLGLLTLSDFFRLKFGAISEVLSALIMVPSYFGWIAAQFVALAGILELFFGIPIVWGIFIAALVGMGYTLMGGMWSVTLTDGVQMLLVIVGLLILAVTLLLHLGEGDTVQGVQRLVDDTPPKMLTLVPTEKLADLLGWISVFCIGALGNLPGQDLMQRVFACRSANVARGACLAAGVAYLTIGLLPIGFGLTARLLYPEELERAILPALASSFLSPPLAVVFLVAIISAILSTIDSAILSPASVLAQNLLAKLRFVTLADVALNRLAVVAVTAGALALAYSGESAYALLEGAYAMTLVGLFVPLTMGIYRRPRRGASAVAAMLTGVCMWGFHYFQDWESFCQPLELTSVRIPVELAATLLSFIVYLACDLWPGKR